MGVETVIMAVSWLIFPVIVYFGVKEAVDRRKFWNEVERKDALRQGGAS